MHTLNQEDQKISSSLPTNTLHTASLQNPPCDIEWDITTVPDIAGDGIGGDDLCPEVRVELEFTDCPACDEIIGYDISVKSLIKQEYKILGGFTTFKDINSPIPGDWSYVLKQGNILVIGSSIVLPPSSVTTTGPTSFLIMGQSSGSYEVCVNPQCANGYDIGNKCTTYYAPCQ